MSKTSSERRTRTGWTKAQRRYGRQMATGEMVWALRAESIETYQYHVDLWMLLCRTYGIPKYIPVGMRAQWKAARVRWVLKGCGGDKQQEVDDGG